MKTTEALNNARERIENRAKETLNEQNEGIARQIAMQEREDEHEWRDEAPGWQEGYREAEDGTRYSIKLAMRKVEIRAREIAQNFN